MVNPIEKVKVFCVEVIGELKRSSWPTRGELRDSTLMVIVTMIILGAFVALADLVFMKLVRLLMGT